MYNAAMKTRFSKLDLENLAMKIQVQEKQHPSDKIFFRGYGNVIEENNQEYGEADTENKIDFSDDIKVSSNFKVNHSNFFCEEAYQSKSQKSSIYNIYRIRTENSLFASLLSTASDMIIRSRITIKSFLLGLPQRGDI